MICSTISLISGLAWPFSVLGSFYLRPVSFFFFFLLFYVKGKGKILAEDLHAFGRAH